MPLQSPHIWHHLGGQCRDQCALAGALLSVGLSDKHPHCSQVRQTKVETLHSMLGSAVAWNAQLLGSSTAFTLRR
eukprot:2648153-Amphidinium_carterae.1